MKVVLALPNRFLLALALATLGLTACNTARPPATPSNFKAISDATPRVVLSWEAAAGAVDYVLERKTNSGNFAVLGVVTNTGYTDESVDYSTTYTYRLTARNNAAASSPVEQSVTTPARPPAPPDAPTDFQATPDDTPKVMLRWTAPVRVARYVLERRARDGSYITLSSTLPASTTEYTDTNVGSGTSYTYRLTPYNSAGSGSPATVLVETPAYSEPGFTQTASSYSFADDSSQDPGIDPLTSPDLGLDVEYFDNPDLTGLFARRMETNINHTFSGQPPRPGMGPDTFSIRWTGLITAPVSGTYTFTVLTDDRVRLWVNDQLLISAWFDQNLTRRSATIALSAGQAYRIKLEYYNQDARGAVKLRWAYPSQSEQIVPPSAFVRHQKARIGYFGPKLPWPTVATHAALLPDGRVMTFHGLDPVGKGQSDNYRDYSKHASSQVFVWTPGTPTDAQSQARYDNTRTDLFCAGYVLAANGKLYLAGGNLGYDYSPPSDSGEYGFAAGHTHTNIFDPSTNTWSTGPDMTQGRWYPSVITLPNEEMLIIGGNADSHNGNGIDDDKNYIPDVWDPFTNTLRRLTGASSSGKGIEHFYPRVHVAPNGQVLLTGSYKNWYYLNTSGTGSWGSINNQTYNRYYGSSVMYQPGKILVLGGGANNISGGPMGGETAQVVELNQANQSISVRNVGPMAYKRTHVNATLMPDGRIFVNGGNEDGVNFSNATAVYESEIWSPLTETFKRAAEAQCPRTYHSTALLLLDGTIITMGGGATGGDDPAGAPECDKTKGNAQKVNQLNAEIYYPPYLHNADGSPASRPVVQSAPDRISYGQSFTLSTDVPATVVERVTLVAFGAVTHAFNMGQRFIELNFTRTGSNSLQVTAPASPNLATPGYYQLYVLDGRGVPSEARVVRLRDASLP